MKRSLATTTRVAVAAPATGREFAFTTGKRTALRLWALRRRRGKAAGLARGSALSMPPSPAAADADLAYIGTPALTAIALEAPSSRRPSRVAEKPLAATSTDADAIVDAAEAQARGVVLGVNIGDAIQRGAQRMRKLAVEERISAR